MVGSPTHCALLFGTTRRISSAKYALTSGFASSRAPFAITSPSMLYRSTFLSGLCSPERGHSRSRWTNGPISSACVSGTSTNASPFIGSTTACCDRASIHSPPQRFLPIAGVAADIVAGSAVAHDGIEAWRRPTRAITLRMEAERMAVAA